MAQNLPTELIELIFTHVDPTDHATCAAVSKTNRLGYRAITPQWYHTVGISDIHIIYRHRQRKLHLLVRTLFENPKLASYARVMKQDLYSGMGSTLPHNDYGHDISGTAIEEKLRNELGLDTQSGIGSFLCELVDQRQLCNAWHFFILMLLCPNVETLILTGKGSVMKSYNLFKDLVYASENSAKPCGLQKVQSAHLNQTFTEGDATFEDVMPLLRLSNLQKLEVDGMAKCMYPAAALGYTLEDDIISDVRHLSFHNFASTERELQFVLACCDKLKSLSIKWTSATSTNTFANFCKRLVRGATELEFLHLECDMAAYEDLGLIALESPPAMGRLGNCSFLPINGLADLPSLKHLNISKNILFGTTMYKRTSLTGVLPVSLQKLTLNAPKHFLAERDMLLIKDESLKRVELELLDPMAESPTPRQVYVEH